nr:AAA family ATPase [uncultured Cohaesibacter sp.]
MVIEKAFLDREAEVPILLNFLKRIPTGPEICVLHAVSGVGKSSLTSEVITQCQAALTVRVAPLNHANASGEAFYYLGLFAQAMAKAQSDAGFSRSFDAFVDTKQKESISGAFLRDLQDIAKKFYLPVQSAKAIKDRIRKNERSKALSITNHLRNEVDILLDYLTFALDGSGYVIVLENTQSIDVKSYEALLALLERGYAHKWIFEYTDSNQSLPAHSGNLPREQLVQDCRSTGAQVASMKLEKLPVQFVVKLLQRSQDPTQIILNSYLESEGNLRPLVDFDIHLLSADQELGERKTRDLQVINLVSITQRKVERLPIPQRLLLIVVHLLDGACEKATLQEMINRSSGPLSMIDLSMTLDALIESNLLTIKASNVRIAHDQISDAVGVVGDPQGLMLSARTEVSRFLEYNLRFPGCGLNLPQIATKLCQLYLALGEPERVLKLLQATSPDLVATGRIDRLVILLREVEEMLDCSQIQPGFQQEFFALLLEVYYHSGNYSDALRCVDKLKPGKNRSLLKAALLDLNGQHSQSLSAVELLLDADDKLDITTNITARLLRVASLRSLNQHEECEILFRELLEDQTIQHHEDYPLILRGAEMVLPFNLAAPLLIRARHELTSQERLEEAGRAAVISAFVLTILGEFDAAMENLQAAYSLFDGTTTGRQALLNNHLVLLLYQGKLGQEAEDLLQMARLSAQPEYDRLVLYSNSMIFHAMRQEKAAAIRAAKILEEFIEKSSVADKDIRRILHFNLSRFWLDEDPSRSELHLSLSKNNQVVYLRDVWIKRWKIENWTNPRYCGEGVLPYIPAFLSYWSVDISKLVLKCQ